MNFEKVSLLDRLLMIWYWCISFKNKYHIDGKNYTLTDYNSLWNLLQRCDFSKPDVFKSEYFIGRIEFHFDCEGDLRSVKIDDSFTDLPRSLIVLAKKKREQIEKDLNTTHKKDPIDSVVEAYTEARGL